MSPIIVDEYSSVLSRMNIPSGCHLSWASPSSTCPCCNTERYCEDTGNRETLNEPSFIHGSARKRNLMDADEDDIVNDEEDTDDDDDESVDEREVLPGFCHEGIKYYPTRILVEGWLHKKGTGNDFFGSRTWKARYCRLVHAEVDGEDFEVPLLLLYWFPASDKPSTVITLESTVVVPMDCEHKDDWSKHCFNVVNVRGESSISRCFTAPQNGRDGWVSAINDALYNFEKAKSKAKLEVTSSPRSIMGTNASHPVPDLLCSDSTVEMSLPSRSPRAVPPRPPPRPDTLVGETYLLD